MREATFQKLTDQSYVEVFEYRLPRFPASTNDECYVYCPCYAPLHPLKRYHLPTVSWILPKDKHCVPAVACVSVPKLNPTLPSPSRGCRYAYSIAVLDDLRLPNPYCVQIGSMLTLYTEISRLPHQSMTSGGRDPCERTATHHTQDGLQPRYHVLLCMRKAQSHQLLGLARPPI